MPSDYSMWKFSQVTHLAEVTRFRRMLIKGIFTAALGHRTFTLEIAEHAQQTPVAYKRLSDSLKPDSFSRSQIIFMN